MWTLSLFLVSLASNTPECDAFPAQTSEPLSLELAAITGENLGGENLNRRNGERRLFRVGSLAYDERGFSAMSHDPRFAGVTVDAVRGLYHRCGFSWDGGPNAWDLRLTFPQTSSLRFRPTPGVGPVGSGAISAAMAGALPVVDGYQAGASWPLLRGFIGLMHPISGGNETLIVLFDIPQRRVETRILARLPMRFQFISVLPLIHASGFNIHLFGRDPGGPLRQVMFWSHDPTGLDPSLTLIE